LLMSLNLVCPFYSTFILFAVSITNKDQALELLTLIMSKHKLMYLPMLVTSKYAVEKH